MKTFVFDNNYSHNVAPDPLSWYFLADSALTNAGKPFFIPDFAKDFEAIPTVAVRINRLGKSVAARYGSRYYAEYAPALHFRASDLLLSQRAKGLPGDMAWSFDRSFIMSDFIKYPSSGYIEVCLRKNGVADGAFCSSKMLLSLNEVISRASCANTLKIGDLIVPALPSGSGIAIGDLVELSVGDDNVLSVQIK